MYNSMIPNLYIVLCVHHPKSSLLPSPFIPPLPSPINTSSHPAHPSLLVITMLLSVSVRFLFGFGLVWFWGVLFVFV